MGKKSFDVLAKRAVAQIGDGDKSFIHHHLSSTWLCAWEEIRTEFVPPP